jgi:hypothetical protein
LPAGKEISSSHAPRLSPGADSATSTNVPALPWLIAISLGTIAAGLFYRFGHGLTADEPFSANEAHLTWRQLGPVFAWDNAPIYLGLLKCWTLVFGESEAALRGLSALCYGGVVLFTGLAGRRIVGPITALAAAVLLAASDRIGLEHAATARPYAMLSCMAAAALMQSVALLDAGNVTRRRTLRLLLLAITHFIGLMTHPTFVVISAACAISSLVTSRRLSAPAFLAPVLAVAAYFLVWGHIIRATIALQVTSWMTPPTATLVQHGMTLVWSTGPTFILLGAVLVLLFQHGTNARRLLGGTSARWTLVATAVAWILPVVVSRWWPIFEATRTPMMLLPLTSLSVALLLDRLGGARAALGLALCCLAAAGLRIATISRAEAYSTRANLSAIVEQMHCGDTLVATGLGQQFVEYYFRRIHAPECLHVSRFPASLLNWERHRRADRMEELQHEASMFAAGRAGEAATSWTLAQSRGETADASVALEAAMRRELDCRDTVMGAAMFDHVVRCVPRRR